MKIPKKQMTNKPKDRSDSNREEMSNEENNPRYAKQYEEDENDFDSALEDLDTFDNFDDEDDDYDRY